MPEHSVISLNDYRASRKLLQKLGDAGWDMRHMKEKLLFDGQHLVFIHDLESGFSMITVYDYRLDNARTDDRFRNQVFCEQQLQRAIEQIAKKNLQTDLPEDLAALVSTYILRSGYFEMLRKYEKSYAAKGRDLSILIFRHDRDIHQTHALLLAPHGLIEGQILKPGELTLLANTYL
ncbi:MAG: hypothetical protein R3312_03495 [Gammaproteobacteria bacterium]|nr:hypothetical protein [Gammaproteobacteria bacterium]